MHILCRVLLPRFFAPLATATAQRVELPDEEATHLTRVLRLTTGDRVRVFDGLGAEWLATIEEATRRHVSVVLQETLAPAPEARTSITLAIAVLKGDKMDDIVRDAVMLGVIAVRPFVSTRTEISAASIARSERIARWQRIAIASVKQCGRAVVPLVHPVSQFDDIVNGEDATLMLVEPHARSTPSRRADGETGSTTGNALTSLRDVPRLARLTLIVGPEGGWTTDEVQRASARGTMLLTLGNQTLRADAVPLVALTAVRVWWDDF